MNWQESLRDLLSGYFGDNTIDEGIEEMLFVTACDADYHQRWLAAIEAGVDGASDGQAVVVEIVMSSNAYYVRTASEAREFLEELRSRYLARYKAETNGA